MTQWWAEQGINKIRTWGCDLMCMLKMFKDLSRSLRMKQALFFQGHGMTMWVCVCACGTGPPPFAGFFCSAWSPEWKGQTTWINECQEELYIKKVGFTFHKPPTSLTNCASTCLNCPEYSWNFLKHAYICSYQTISGYKMPAKLNLLTEPPMELAKAFHKQWSER